MRRKDAIKKMRIINLGQNNSILNRFISQMRDKDIQKDSMRFRTNLERVGEIFAYEISKFLEYSRKKFVTPLGIAEIPTHNDKIVVATILRAGLPLHQGLLNFFDDAQNAFVTAYRKYDKSEGYHIKIEYVSSPDLKGKTLILADAMLATGSSIEMAYQKLCENGEPKHTHLVCPISSIYAVEYLEKHLPADKVTLWVASIDEELTSRSYIVPGLGDAGDLAYGIKR